MSPDVLRRKLQKKKKRKPYRKCPQCGDWMECSNVFFDANDVPHLVVRCRYFGRDGCGYSRELFWSGGGMADTYPAKAE